MDRQYSNKLNKQSWRTVYKNNKQICTNHENVNPKEDK